MSAEHDSYPSFGRHFGQGRQQDFGTVRLPRSHKRTTEDVPSIDIRHWCRLGLLRTGQEFIWHWQHGNRFSARILVRAEWEHIMLKLLEEKTGTSITLELSRIPCRLGGHRPLFICPRNGCGRKAAILYGLDLPSLACRHCHDLVYRSQREPAYRTAARKAEEIRRLLGWEPGILNPEGPRPKGMRRRTFRHLVRLHDELVEKALAGVPEVTGKD